MTNRHLRHLGFKTRRILSAFKFNLLSPLTISLIIAFVYSLFLLFIAVGPIFRISAINCTYINKADNCPEIIQIINNDHLGKLIYRIDEKQIQSKLVANIPSLQSVEVNKQFPNTLKIELIDDLPIAYLTTKNSDVYYVISKNHRISELIDLRNQNLPTIYASNSAELILSEYISDKPINYAVKIIENLESSLNKVESVTIRSPMDIRIYLSNRKVAIFSISKDVENQLNTLQLVLSQPTINSDPEYIDVRYEKPSIKSVVD